MIGLWQAIMDYRVDRSASFISFATLCVTRHILTAIKSAKRFKQGPLNLSSSIDSSASGAFEPVFRFSDGRADHQLDPQELILRKEANSDLNAKIKHVLSSFEWSVFTGYTVGKTYQEISSDLNCKAKSVDNALGRIKRKIAIHSLQMPE